MNTNARSPAGRLLTFESLDHSRRVRHDTHLPNGKAYDFGAPADHIAELLSGKNNDIDEQAYDFGAAADYNTDLLKRKDNETSELALPAFLNTTLQSTSYTATLVSEAQTYFPVDFNAGDWDVSNEIFPAEPNVEVSMAGFLEAGNISKQLHPTSFVNHEEITGQIATVPLFSRSPQKLSGATDRSNEGILGGLKGRLSCDHPGCNKTFPRKYELKRHTESIHTQNFQVVCPVYGCHRTTKPFKREDKFNEHFRKHDGSRGYRCLIETCQSAPFDIPGLIDHLTKSHYGGDDAQPNLDFINKKVLGTRSIPFLFHRLCLDGRDVCPLASTGCTWRIRANFHEYSEYKFEMQQHIVTHELSDRRQGKELLRNFFENDENRYLDDGTNNCMLCSFQASGYFHRELFFNHLVTGHSREERGSVLETTYQILDDYLARWYHQPRGERLNVKVLENECTGAGFKFAHSPEVPPAFLATLSWLL